MDLRTTDVWTSLNKGFISPAAQDYQVLMAATN